MTINSVSTDGKPACSAPQAQPNPRQRILMVDDEKAIRLVNSAVLACSGYHVDTAEDGAAAWDALQLNKYDLVITDHRMPKVTGIELLKKIHAAQLDVPAIMATGALPQDELDRHPWLALYAVLLKPYGFDELLKTVKNVLYAAASQRTEMAPPPNWRGQPSANGLGL